MHAMLGTAGNVRKEDGDGSPSSHRPTDDDDDVHDPPALMPAPAGASATATVSADPSSDGHVNLDVAGGANDSTVGPVEDMDALMGVVRAVVVCPCLLFAPCVLGVTSLCMVCCLRYFFVEQSSGTGAASNPGDGAAAPSAV